MRFAHTQGRMARHGASMGMTSLRSRRCCVDRVVKSLVLAVMVVAGRAEAQETLRPEIGSVLQVAQDLVNAGYADTLEKLVATHPAKAYWVDLLSAIQNKPDFSDRLMLDMLRLETTTQTLDDARLHLAQARLASGDKDKAIELFSALRGADGTADLGRLWAIVARSR